MLETMNLKPLRCVVPLMCIGATALIADQPNNSSAIADVYLKAIRANDLVALRALTQAGASGVRDRLDSTPLHGAALYGSADAVRILLDAGADPNARDKSEATPLLYAAYSLEKTRLLVEKGGDVNAKAKGGYTPLWVAAGAPGNDSTVRYLIEKGADLKAILPTGFDYLQRVAGHEEAQTVRWLLDKGIDPHRATNSGDTALTESLVCDGGAKARVLLGAGSNVNAFTTSAGAFKNGPIDSFGVTPLMLAATCGDDAVVSSLLKAGANVNALDHRHMSALMMAVAVDHAQPETARLLIVAGASLNIGDRNSETALDWAHNIAIRRSWLCWKSSALAAGDCPTRRLNRPTTGHSLARQSTELRPCLRNPTERSSGKATVAWAATTSHSRGAPSPP
jgi:ankyrin repeat protein